MEEQQLYIKDDTVVNDKQQEKTEFITKRDLGWIIFILILAIITILAIRLSDNKSVLDVFSFMANGISISLAIVAIVYAFYQSVQAQMQNQDTINILNNIDTRINNVIDSIEKQIKSNENINNDINDLSGRIENLATGTVIPSDKEEIKKLIDKIKADQLQRNKILNQTLQDYRISVRKPETSSRRRIRVERGRPIVTKTFEGE